GEIRLAFLRIELPPHRRMDAVGADQDIRLILGDNRAPAIDECRGDLVAALDAALEDMTGTQRVGAKPRARRLGQHHLEPPAMHRILRPGEAGGAAALFLPDRLPELVEE